MLINNKTKAKLYIITAKIALVVFTSSVFSQVPKFGVYKSTEVRFSVFGVCGSTRALIGGTTV
ncbi:MAG: hypothetical protein NZ928_05355 [Endomicrobia bacterium]|nr:hypothetical protein [Endomicrobiia bacterium]MDW8056560.1 hypothetical protein [Elusimicrobiota bacterium]